MPYRFPIKVGDRVALAPHTDLWMRGVRFGDVWEVRRYEGSTTYRVRLSEDNYHWLSADDLLGAVNHPSGQKPEGASP